jgi:starch synthase
MKEKKNLRILMTAAELAPWAKTGGLGDVTPALSAALAAAGHEVRFILPRYGNGKIIPKPDWELRQLTVHLPGGGTVSCRLLKPRAQKGDVQLYFLESDSHFGGPEIYGQAGNLNEGKRFSFLALAALDFCEDDNWIPDIIHGHDWPCGVIPAMAIERRKTKPSWKNVKTFFTIHNANMRGNFPPEILDYSGLPGGIYNHFDGFNHLGGVSTLKGGIQYADMVNTVSPTYAEEMLTSAYGATLEGAINYRKNQGAFVGIVNGLDTSDWNAGNATHLAKTYSETGIEAGKKENRNALCASSDKKWRGTLSPVDEKNRIPLFGVVARLDTRQKGINLFAEMIENLLEKHEMQIVLLGSAAGNDESGRGLEEELKRIANIASFAGKIKIYIGYSDPLAHQIQAASDFLLVPSIFEPCGLTQLIASRYGTLPIVRDTGGLHDTVYDFSSPVETENANKCPGILFKEKADGGEEYDLANNADYQNKLV